MPTLLKGPSNAWETQEVSLAGLNYTFEYKFNTRDERWRLSIYLEGNPVKVGIKIMENQDLLSRYIIEDFSHGTLICLRMKDDGLPVGFSNLGIDLPYTILYYTNEELEAL